MALLTMRQAADTVGVSRLTIYRKVDETELYEFMKLYKEEFGEDISLDDAKEMAERIAELYEVDNERGESEEHNYGQQGLQ